MGPVAEQEGLAQASTTWPRGHTDAGLPKSRCRCLLGPLSAEILQSVARLIDGAPDLGPYGRTAKLCGVLPIGEDHLDKSTVSCCSEVIEESTASHGHILG